MVDIGDLSNEIAKALKTYTRNVEEGIEKVQDDVSKETVKRLKQTSPELTGDYARGWGRKKTENGYTVYNRTDYQLTHLLEYGHAKRGGGRVASIPHIRPVEEKVIDEYVKEVEKVIRG